MRAGELSLLFLQLFLFNLCLPVVARAAIVQVDDFDTRVVYNAPVLPQSSCGGRADNEACATNWWYELGNGGQLEGVDFNSSIHDTFGPGTTATLQFAGSSIAVYGVKLDFGAKGIATVDGTPRAFDCVSTDGTVHARQLLFLLGGLDPTVNHKVVVAYDDSSFGPANNRRWLGIDYFEIDTTGVPSTTASVASTTSPGTQSSSNASSVLPATSPSPKSSPNAGIIAGGVVGGIVLLAVVGLLIALARRRLRKDARPEQQQFGYAPGAETRPLWIPPHVAPYTQSANSNAFSHQLSSGQNPVPHRFALPVGPSTVSYSSGPTSSGSGAWAAPPLPPYSAGKRGPRTVDEKRRLAAGA